MGALAKGLASGVVALRKHSPRSFYSLRPYFSCTVCCGEPTATGRRSCRGRNGSRTSRAFLICRTLASATPLIYITCAASRWPSAPLQDAGVLQRLAASG